MAATREEVYDRVKEVLVDKLGVKSALGLVLTVKA